MLLHLSGQLARASAQRIPPSGVFLFLEGWSGDDGDPWNASRWPTINTGHASCEVDIQGNQGRLLAGGAAYVHAAAVSASGDLSDFDLTVQMTLVSTGEQYHAIYVRASDEVGTFGDPATGYQIRIFEWTTLQQIQIVPFSGGVAGSALATTDKTWGTDPWNLRVRCVGSSIQVKIWQGSEPGAWDLDITDGAHSSGVIRFATVNGDAVTGRAASWDNLVVTAVESEPPPGGTPDSVTVSGDLQQWHTVVLDVDGPSASETDSPTPFRQYRMDITFSQGALSYIVPGFFAADGNAANSSAVSGSVWRCLFRPPTTGEWFYEIAFHSGTDAATKLPGDNSAMSTVDTNGSAEQVHGAQGSLTVAASDKIGPDWRAPNRGRLEYDGTHYQRFWDTSRPFIRGGIGSPENFLAYYEFDGTQNYGGNFSTNQTDGLHHYDDFDNATNGRDHALDWQTGDPVWQTNKGKGIIGAINYLASTGTNTLYCLLNNCGVGGLGQLVGDSQDVYPWPLADTTDPRDVYDVSKLEQWRIVFEHAMHRGMVPILLFQETENFGRIEGSKAQGVGPLSSVFIREIIARLGHLVVTWCVSEEAHTDASGIALIEDWADALAARDPWGSLVTVHNGTAANEETYGPMVGHATLTGVSYQSNNDSTPNERCQHWRGESIAIPPRWVLTHAENWATPMLPDSSDATHNANRTKDFIGWLMAGGDGAQWYFGGGNAGDHATETFSDRANGWAMTRRVRQMWEFVRVDDPNVTPDNTIVGGATDALGFRLTDAQYVGFFPTGNSTGSPTLQIGSGTYRWRWFHARSNVTAVAVTTAGGDGVQGPTTIALGAPPADVTSDWFVVAVRDDVAIATEFFVLVNTTTGADIALMYEGMTIDTANPYIGSSLAIRAVTTPRIVAQMAFTGLVNRNETVTPYYSHGDSAGTPSVWSDIAPGAHTLTATPRAIVNQAGSAGTPLTINFTVT